MSYNGSGTFTINSTGQPVVAGTVITASAFNALTTDLATGLTTAITKDGQTTTTARITFAQGITSSLVTDSSSVSTGSIITAGGVGIAKALYVGTTANVAGAVTLGGIATFSAQPIFSSLTASSAVATDASKGLVSVTNTGTGNNVLATSPTITTPTISSLSSASATALTLQSAGTTAITVDTSQNVGIGTASPSYKLDVVSTGNSLNSNLASRNTTSGTAAGAQILVGNDSTNDLLVLRALSSTYTSSGVNTANGALVRGGGAGGMTLAATDASGIIKFATGGTTERMRISSAGYVGINNTNPVGLGQLEVQAPSTTAALWVQTGGTTSAYTIAEFRTGSNAPALQVLGDSSVNVGGNLLVGTTSNVGNAKVSVQSNLSASNGINIDDSSNSSGSTFARFSVSSGTLCGYISRVTTTNAVAYNTTSDYRLKENIVPMTGALSKIAQLKPVTYKWKDCGVDSQGFIAHELQEVVPDCVTGEKDAIDAEGNPKYQGIDTSFLVATLTAGIQELKAINDTQAETINALTARITALENA